MPTAVVIGSGPNGLSAAIALAEAGVDVTVHEEQETIGGGARSLELTLPGFVHDVCSAIHPMGEHSPFLRRLELPIEWVHPPAQVAHPLDDEPAVVLELDVGATADALGPDARAYRELLTPFVEEWDAVEPVLLGPLPPGARALARLARALGPRRAQRAARFALADARAVAQGCFETKRARALFAGNAAHSMLPLERRPSAGFALALMTLGHVFGWGFPRGGAQRITDALAERARDLGVEIRAASRVDELPAARRRARRRLAARAAPPCARALPRPLRERAAALPLRRRRVQGRLGARRAGAVARRAGRARGTVHLGGSLDEISASEWAPWTGRHADRPFVLFAQHTRFDPTRAPDDKHTAWAYCHLPNGSTTSMLDRIEAQVERFAPGFRDVVLERSALGPADLEAKNRNLVGGDLNVGAMDLGQLFTRPARKLVPYRTPLAGVYLCSAATPPGGGVHGMCGWSAARVALADLGGRLVQRR